MKKSMKEIISGKSTVKLKERQTELHDDIKRRQKIIYGYKHLILQKEYNCLNLIKEYEMIDRTLFFRERRVQVLKPIRKGRQQSELIVKKNIEDMTDGEASLMLSHLLAMRKQRQSDGG